MDRSALITCLVNFFFMSFPPFFKIYLYKIGSSQNDTADISTDVFTRFSSGLYAVLLEYRYIFETSIFDKWEESFCFSTSKSCMLELLLYFIV